MLLVDTPGVALQMSVQSSFAFLTTRLDAQHSVDACSKNYSLCTGVALFVSPVQPALFPGSLRPDGLMSSLLVSHKVETTNSVQRRKHTSSAVKSQIHHITPIARNDTKVPYLKIPNEHPPLFFTRRQQLQGRVSNSLIFTTLKNHY